MNINHLAISWTTSRGRDTYGYNICRLDDRQGRRRFRTCGGGYDMIGTVFGQWLQENYQERLREFFAARKDALQDYGSTGWKVHPDFYGAHVRPYQDGSGFKVSLDGACGFESMRRIAEAIGLELQWEGNRRGHTIGYFVEDKSAQNNQ